MLTELYSFQVPFIEAIQSLNTPLFITAYKLFSFLCDERFFLLFLPLILWNIDRRLGIRLIFFLLIGTLINLFLKDLLHQPRPFAFDFHIKQEELFTDSYGFPSGHAQITLMLWGLLAVKIKKMWAQVTTIIITLSVGLSRIALGVHFPTDVLGGWLIGLIMLLFYLQYTDKIEDKINSFSNTLLFLISLFLPLIIVMFYHSSLAVTLLGAISGMGTGCTLLINNSNMSSSFSHKPSLRCTIGILVLISLYLGLAALFPKTNDFCSLFFRYIRYFTLAFWISAGAPFLFYRLKI